jgi:signal transduction histidine kinase
MHRRRSRDDEKDLAPAMDPEFMTAEERALHEARRVADRKAGMLGDALKFSLIAILLLAFVWPVGIVVLVLWGPRHLRALYRLVVEPRLRERFLEEEIEKQVQEHLSEERRVLESEHARSLEELSARVAHEIRNPITAAKSLVQQMEEDPKAPENMEYARVALSELSRVERSVSHLLRFARDEEMRVGAVRLADVVESALETYGSRLARSGVELERRIETEGRLEGDAEQLRRAVINLIGNAVDAAEQGAAEPGRIEVHLGENLAGSAVWLRVADNGPGLDEDALAKMWSPFYTQKPGGTGLGLAITRKLVESHGGEIEAGQSASGGAEFTISLPKRRGGRA